MIAFIDTEVGIQDHKVKDFGVVREDGAVLHTHSASEFASFVRGCSTLCGHNILDFDMKYIKEVCRLDMRTGTPAVMDWLSSVMIVDTLHLSPLLFPKKPYHELVKDDKLQVDELNNPVNDAKKARELFHQEWDAWQRLNPMLRSIYRHLLEGTREFEGFFHIIPKEETLLYTNQTTECIRFLFQGKICDNADIGLMVRNYPVELAYALAVIGVDDFVSMTPAWVMRNYPKVANVMDFLRNRPCGGCEYCRSRLDAHQGLKEFFKYDTFRQFDGVPMQQQAVEAALRGESLLTIFPTGGGKSLTFQLPALMAGRNTHGLTVVISPLQSLMKDQVDNLQEKRGITNVVTINGSLDPLKRQEAIEQVLDGSASLLYIAPEMLRSRTIEKLLLSRSIARFVIDEAHCFSAWGQDFRVDYLYIGRYLRELQEKKQLRQPIPVSCFTATAKQKVISDICEYFRKSLGLELKIFAAKAERENLRYQVIHTQDDSDKYNKLRNLIMGHKCPTIVYVARTRRTSQLAEKLTADGIPARPYHGKMQKEERILNQNAFMQGDVNVMVATTAFGMGVDKEDVGLVVHYNISDSLENYVQESGRAGRDSSMNAECYVLFGDNDLDKHFQLLNQSKLSLSEIQQVWRALRDLSTNRTNILCSALEIARKAGWDEDSDDIETHVKAAIAALENAGYIQRGSNAPQIFATSITVHTMDEARERLNKSPLFDEKTREAAASIIHSLISYRAKMHENDRNSENHIDYLSDRLGLKREDVIKSINLMRQEGLLADNRDMIAGIGRIGTLKKLDEMLRIEEYLLNHIGDIKTGCNYKQINEQTITDGLTGCTIRRLRMITNFWAIHAYAEKEEKHRIGSVTLQLKSAPESTRQRFYRRASLCRFAVKQLIDQNSSQSTGNSTDKGQRLVNFSIVEMLKRFIATSQELQFADNPPSVAEMDEALLYLSKIELLNIESGFITLYNPMSIQRLVERHIRYNKEQYRSLDEYYKQRIQQIHIVGEYANMMVRDTNAARQYVTDYFQMDYGKFILKYFKGSRRTEITKNISSHKYRDIFDTLSSRQSEIVHDQQSKYIVVAAGPGSGKTHMLVRKLASLLLLEDVKSEQLLMLTFSRSAATEFKKRLIGLVDDAAHYVDIKTFHSYSLDLLGLLGSEENLDHAVRRAAEMIAQGEVEMAKIAKSVLVIDEAQDMGDDDFRLVQALMQRNEDMRVIAVGDDDQNIYQFRGSDSEHLRALAHHDNAKLYTMTENYRSCPAVVEFANRFVTFIPNRMKNTPIEAITTADGTVEVVKTSNLPAPDMPQEGTCAFLTYTNEQAMQMAYLLEKNGHLARLIQQTDGFRFGNLAEVRFFLGQLPPEYITIPPDLWNPAKKQTLKVFPSSHWLQRFFGDFESTHKTFYRSDLDEYIYESNIEDFFSSDGHTILVSTIHKAKGREFDTVFLLAASLGDLDPAKLRMLYVGITRAKRNLHIYTDLPIFDRLSTNISPSIPVKGTKASAMPMALSLGLKDIWLDYAKDKQDLILPLRSGDKLSYKNGYLISGSNNYVSCLSQACRERVTKLEAKGYTLAGAEVSFIVFWSPQETEKEYAILLANLYLEPNQPILS